MKFKTERLLNIKNFSIRIHILLFLSISFFSCATGSLKYNRNKILEKYSKEYEIFVDNEKTNLEVFFLDKDNIKNIRINKRKKEIKITQHKTTKLLELKNINLDSLYTEKRGSNKRKIELIVIDGIPLDESLNEKIKIDPNSIESFEIITKEEMNNPASMFCRAYNGDVLLIMIK